METGLIARRYATALADYAGQEGQEQQVYDQVIRWIALYQEDKSVREQLTSPVLKKEVKQALFREWMGGEASPCLERFFQLVLDHQREKYLPFIFNSYVSIYKQRHHIVDVTLTTASPIDEETSQRIAQLARKADDQAQVKLHPQVDESLIGGFVFRVDDLLLDASLSHQLALLRKQYINGKSLW